MSSYQQFSTFGVQVHPHIVGGIRTIDDGSGTIKVVSTPSARQFGNTEVISEEPVSKDSLIEKIEGKVSIMGFTASKFVGVDEFDGLKYGEEETKLISRNIKFGAFVGIVIPYNTLIYHTDNQWLFDCVQMRFCHRYNLIPRTHHNLPSVLNIPRSDGSVQTGILLEDEALVVRKSQSRGDTQERVYVIAHFSLTNTEETEPTLCTHNKCIAIEEILEHNPELCDTGIEFTIPQFSEEEINKEYERHDLQMKKDVMTYYNQLYVIWKEEMLLPSIQKINEKKNVITIH